MRKGPDGRYIIETFLAAIIVPLPFFLLIYAFLREEFTVNFLLAFLGIILFWVLWLPAIWNGTYYQPIASQQFDVVYRFAASALLFIYTSAATFMAKSILMSTREIKEAYVVMVSVALSYVSWIVGRSLFGRISKFPDHSPYACLLQALTGFFALFLILLAVGVIYAIYFIS